MNRGNPDYFGQSIFPAYGDIYEATKVTRVSGSSAYTELFNIPYKCELVSLYLNVYFNVFFTGFYLESVFDDLPIYEYNVGMPSNNILNFFGRDLYSVQSYRIFDKTLILKLANTINIKNKYTLGISPGVEGDISIIGVLTYRKIL